MENLVCYFLNSGFWKFFREIEVILNFFLGHGNKTSCDRPRVIEALRGKDIIFIACGGAHSAAITATGNFIGKNAIICEKSFGS